MTVRTRFAPSPTGYLHVGGARTALFSWLYARRHGGHFVLRIEDTDLERSTAESVNAILEGMTWLGLEYDEGPFFQTHRFQRYDEVIGQLIAAGKAYRCDCSKERLEALREEQMRSKQKPRYDGHCRHRNVSAEGPHVVRFLNPEDGEVAFDDMVHGRIAFANAELDDLVIRRTDGSPTYNFTVVVDDMDMEITHVIRGDDHINNTPRQINMLRALGRAPPRYAHVPMILGDDGSRLSKRHGAVSVMHINDVNKAASAFNTDKLLWLNQHYIKASDPARIARLLSPRLGDLGVDPAEGPDLVEVVKAQQERAKTLVEMAEISRFFYQDFADYEEQAAKKHLRAGALEPLRRVHGALAALADWTPVAVHETVQRVADALQLGMGKVAQPLRVAVSGRAATPGIDVTVWLVGREATLRRIGRAIAWIEVHGA